MHDLTLSRVPFDGSKTAFVWTLSLPEVRSIYTMFPPLSTFPSSFFVIITNSRVTLAITRCVVLGQSDVSEEHIASMLRTEEYAK
jgi:hypothetical protein